MPTHTVIGEAEGVWVELINDFEQGKLKRKYQKPDPYLKKFISLNYKKIRRGLLKQFSILTTRGCPYKCDFCSVSDIYGQRIKHIPIDNIVRYLKESKSKYVTFQDDNIVGDPVYAKELFRAITPLKIKWGSMGSLSIADDPELLQLAKESGCIYLLVGIESISEKRLKILQKEPDNIQKLEISLKKINESGILIHAYIVFGFDSETKETFSETVNFLIKNKVLYRFF